MLWFSLRITVDVWNPLSPHSYIQVINVVCMVRPPPTTITPTDTYLSLDPHRPLRNIKGELKEHLYVTRFFISDKLIIITLSYIRYNFMYTLT